MITKPYTYTDGNPTDGTSSMLTAYRNPTEATLRVTEFGHTTALDIARDDAPSVARGILYAAGRNDTLVIENIGPLPAVTTDEDGDRKAIAERAIGYADLREDTERLRDRATVYLALYLDRLVSDADPKPVLREDVRVALKDIRDAITGGYANTAEVDALAARLTELPGLTITPIEESS